MDKYLPVEISLFRLFPNHYLRMATIVDGYRHATLQSTGNKNYEVLLTKVDYLLLFFVNSPLKQDTNYLLTKCQEGLIPYRAQARERIFPIISLNEKPAALAARGK